MKKLERKPGVIILEITFKDIRSWLMRSVVSVNQEAWFTSIEYRNHKGSQLQTAWVYLHTYQPDKDLFRFWLQGKTDHFEVEIGRGQIPDAVRHLVGSLDTFPESDPEEITFKVKGWKYPGKLPGKIVFQDPPTVKIVKD